MEVIRIHEIHFQNVAHRGVIGYIPTCGDFSHLKPPKGKYWVMAHPYKLLASKYIK